MADDLFPALLGFALRSAALLAFTWLVTAALMRRMSASARHFVWTCAVAAAALIPAVALTTPSWKVPAPVPVARVLPVVQPDPAPAVPAASRAARTEPDDPTRRATPPAVWRPTAADTALIAWAGGSVVVVLYLLLGVASTVRLRQRARPAGLDTNDTQALTEALGIGRAVTILEGDTTIPMVCGVWRPFIVLPDGASEWPEARRHVVLLHELAHIKRRDCLTQLLAQVVCAAYWFNPLAWIAARRLRVERERACDDFVLAAGASESDYASHLLDIAQAVQPSRLSPIGATSLAMARRSQLEGRLMAILDPAIRRKSARAARLAAAALVALVTIPLAALRITAPATAAAPMPSLALEAQETQPSRPAQARQSARAPQSAQAQAARPPLDERLRRTLNRSLIEFAEDGDVEAVEAMLAAGADVDARVDGDGSPLISAAGEGRYEMVRLLLDKGANPNLLADGDGTALIAAAEEGHADVVDLLLLRGADINLRADGDGSALIAAAEEGHVEVVRHLIDRGANVDLIVDGDGTALIAAAGEGHTDVVDLLLQRGANPNLIADGNETALIEASNEGHLDVVRLLVSKGADVNLGVWVDEVMWYGDARDVGLSFRDAPRRRVFRTPLSEAREDRHLDVVRFLISAGARD